MALAMMGGLIAGTVLTLTFLPALYALTFGLEVKAAVQIPALSAPQALTQWSAAE